MLITEDMLKDPEELQDRIGKYLEYPEKQPTKFVIQLHLRGPALTKLTSSQRSAIAKASIENIRNPSGTLKEAIDISKGVSLHTDMRIGITTKTGKIKHLVGRSVVGLRWPGDLGILENQPGKGYRAEEKCIVPDIPAVLIGDDLVSSYSEYPLEDVIGIVVEGISPWCNEWEYFKADLEELARQPVSWLKVEGYQGPGTVGATVEGGGLFNIAETGEAIVGSLKPYFQEYFLKGTKGIFKDWVRIVVRGVNVPRIDPETKEPIGKERELLWRIMVAKDSKPYAISSRAMKKNWVPPRGVEPFPIEWAKKKWPEQYQKWKTYVTEQWKKQPKGTEKESLSRARFTLHENSWMGQEVIRRMRVRNYYLRLGDKPARGPRSFGLSSNPLQVESVAAFDEGRVAKKWMTFEGEIKPGQRYNPLKRINTTMTILDTGACSYELEKSNGKEIIRLNFKGKKLKGNYLLIQEEKGADIYTLQPGKTLSLDKAKFVLDAHEVGGKTHWDVRIQFSSNDILEWNLTKNPLDIKKEEPIESLRKRCKDDKWMTIEGKVRVGSLDTEVKKLDKGSVDVIELTNEFSSFVFHGEKLRGYWISKRKAGSKPSHQLFIKSRLPTPELMQKEGHPRGSAFSPLKIEDHQNYFYVDIYDIRSFTYCTLDYKKYLPGLSVPAGIKVYVCFYHRPDKLPGAKVARVRFEKDKWNETKAKAWVRANKLVSFESVQKRG